MSKFCGPVDCADLAAAMAAGIARWGKVRADGAGTLVVNASGTSTTLRFLAGESIEVDFELVLGGAGVFPITLFRNVP
jgi:hypothetical protein